MAWHRSLLAIALAFVTHLPAMADEPLDVHLEFLHRLRERGHAKLAVQYLERLQQNPSPQLKAVLPLESARNSVALATLQDADRRYAIFEQARGELQRFADQNAGKPEGALARLDAARVLALQADDRLARALRHEDAKVREADAEATRQVYEQAGKMFEAAFAQLQQSGRGADALRARFERARCFLDQSRTYLDFRSEKLNKERSTVIDNGRLIFEELAKQHARTPVGDLARAWLIHCFQQTGNPLLAAKYYKEFQADHTEKLSRESHRWARYFHIQGIPEGAAGKASLSGKLFLVQKECLDWLKDFPLEHNRPEGRGVRFELAEASFKQAQVLAKANPKSPEVPPLLDRARQWYETLLEPENEFTDQAQRGYTAATFQRLGDAGRPLEQITTFADCLLQGQYEMYSMSKVADRLTSAPPGEKKSLEEERQQHQRQLVQALRKALSLADAGVPARKVDEAEYYLTSAFLAEGDWHRAAVLGERLARAEPPTRHSTQAAGYALEAYAQALAQSNSLPDRDRYLRLANFVLRDRAAAWKDDPVTSVAHYHLAGVLIREKKYADAVAELQQVRKDFPGYLFAQCQLALTAVEAQQRALTKEEQGRFEETALKALQAIPTLPAGTDPATAQMYFTAQLEQGKILYNRKQYDPLRKLSNRLKGQFDSLTGTLDPKAVAGLTYSFSVLGKLAAYGVAEGQYQAKNYDAAVKTIAEVVGPVEKLAKSGKPVALKDHQLVGSFLGLALRTHLQKNEGARARDYLALLRQIRGEDGQATDLAGVLGSLADELQEQVRVLKEKSDTEGVRRTVQGCSVVLEELTRELDELAKDPARRATYLKTLQFVADTYAGLDRHEEAARLYQQYPDPGPKAEAREVQNYWYLQVMSGRQLRLAHDYPAAKKVLDRVGADPNGRKQILAEKEQIHLLEDQKSFAQAANRWGAFMNQPAVVGQVADNEQMKKLYFDCYYHFASCYYRAGQQQKSEAKKREYLRRAAGYVVALESHTNQSGWQLIGPRFRELLEAELPLRQQYEALKKERAGKNR
jgi:hypothetical protein